MDCVSCAQAVITGSYQCACPHSIAAAMAMCQEARRYKGQKTAKDMVSFNAGVEHVLGASSELAKVYCESVFNLVWSSRANKHNRIAAGVATAELVLLAMTSHVEHATVQQRGALALSFLAKKNPVNIAGMLALEAPNALYAAADANTASMHVQDEVCAALYYIGLFSDGGRTALCTGRAADVATRAYQTHKGLYFPSALLSIVD